jgi:hypothetical protein
LAVLDVNVIVRATIGFEKVRVSIFFACKKINARRTTRIQLSQCLSLTLKLIKFRKNWLSIVYYYSSFTGNIDVKQLTEFLSNFEDSKIFARDFN